MSNLSEGVSDIATPIAVSGPFAKVFILLGIVAVVISVMRQIQIFAKLNEALCHSNPPAGGWRDFGQNCRATAANPKSLLRVLLFVAHGRAILRWYLITVPGGREGYPKLADFVLDQGRQQAQALRHPHVNAFKRTVLWPSVGYMLFALVAALYVWTQQAPAVLWSQTLTGVCSAFWALLFGFFSLWIHRWFSPAFFTFQALALLDTWVHATDRFNYRLPLHAYAETLLPGSDKICTLQLLSSGPPKPCPTATDVYVLLLLLGYWTLNFLFLVGTNLYFEMIDAGDPL